MKRILMMSLFMISCLAASACQQTGSDVTSDENTKESITENIAENGIFAQTPASETEEKDASQPMTEVQSNTEEKDKIEADAVSSMTEADNPTDSAGQVSIRVLENLDLDSSLLTEDFYRSGMDSSLHFYINSLDPDYNVLSCSVSGWDSENQGFYTHIASADIVTQQQIVSYTVQPEISEEYLAQFKDEKNADKKSGKTGDGSGENTRSGSGDTIDMPQKDWQISFIQTQDGYLIRVSGAGVLDGDYFALDQMVSEPALFERYMNPADFYPYTAEELRLMRNEIFAVHGVKFQSEDLNAHFSGKLWYRGTIPADEFSEERLSETERANLALIQEMESTEGLMIDGTDYREAYEALPDAPYLAFLDQYEETGIYVDMRNAMDMGCYYAVSGEVRVPVTLTKAQINALEAGEELEIGPNGWDGEIMMIRKMEEAGPENLRFWYYQKGTEPDENSMDANASLDVENGLYTLWIMSDDTVMKTVYEGDIFILKGATRGDNVALSRASKEQRQLHIPESDEDIWNMEVWSNRLYHDGRGYITAVYYLGD